MTSEVDPHRGLKDAFGRYATGVTVATCMPPGGVAVALTVNSFTSVSLEPPLVLWNVQRTASAFEAFMTADNYAISVLSADQEDVSNRFAAKGGSPLSDDEVTTHKTGAPLLRDRLAGFDCSIFARHNAGDHVILVGKVEHYDSFAGAPLLYYASEYAVGPDRSKR